MSSSSDGKRLCRDPSRPQFYGRRRGKKLRPQRQTLIDTLLPLLRLDCPGDGNTIDFNEAFSSPKQELWMEIGFGAGEHLAALAARHPDCGFIGCEPFINGIAAYLAQHREFKLENVRLFDDDVRLLFPHLPDQCLDGLYILFADPWPKKRHYRRRMIHPDNLDQITRLMKPGAPLWFATDHMDYARWALWHLLRNDRLAWCAERPQDWQCPDHWIETRYERKAKRDGRVCVYYRFQRC